MAISPLYRLTVYAPRSEDPTETTVMTPVAGAPHSDPFVVTTAAGIAGAQPYLQMPRGRVGTLDVLTRRLSVGTMNVGICDVRTGSGNAARWASAFYGDVHGRTRLKNCRFTLERALDGIAANLAPYFAGRTKDTDLNDSLELGLALKDTAETLKRSIFTGAPHPSVTYASMASLMPLGVPVPFGNIPATPRLSGTLTFIGPYITSQVYATLTFDVDPGNWWTSLITKQFFDYDGVGPSRTIVASIPGVLGGADVRLEWPRNTIWKTFNQAIPGSTRVQHFRPGHIYVATRLGDPTTNIPTGTTAGVKFYISQDQPPSESYPLVIGDVHKLKLMADILDGLFSVGSDGIPVPLASRDTSVGGPWDLLLNDPSIGKCRFPITKSWKGSDFIEPQLCVPYGLAYGIDAQGRVFPIDLRRGALTPVFALDDTHLVTDGAISCPDSLAGAVSAIEYHSYTDAPRTSVDLDNSPDQYPDIDPTLIVSSDQYSVLVNSYAPVIDFTTGIVKIDAQGTRVGGGEIGEIDAATGQPRATVVSRDIEAAMNDLLAPFQTGARKPKGVYRLASSTVQGIRVGQFGTINHAKLPNPDTNQRGGVRHVLVLNRTEEGSTVSLEFLDYGAQTAASAPTFGSIAVNAHDANTIDVPVVAGASTDVIDLWSITTPTSTAVRPADTADGWTRVGGSTGSSTIVAGPFPRGMRAWLRAQATAAGAPTNPTGWAYPTPGYLDLTAPSAPSSLAQSNLFANRMDLTWTLADPTLDVELFQVVGGAPGAWTEAMKIDVLPPGSTKRRVGLLASLTQYTFGVRVRDPHGGPSSMNTLTATTTNTKAVAPTPGDLSAALRASS